MSNEHRQQYLKDKFEMSEEERDGMPEDYFIEQILDGYELEDAITLIKKIRSDAESFGVDLRKQLINRLGLGNEK